MKVDFNAVLSFLGRWLAIGIVLHFGMKLGQLLDGVLNFI